MKHPQILKYLQSVSAWFEAQLRNAAPTRLTRR